MTILADSFVHTIDPTIVRLSDTIKVHWYGVSYAAGFLLAWLLARELARRGRLLMTPAQVGDFLTVAMIGVLVGGRLGHVLLYDRALLWSFDDSFPFWGLLAINRGGMASHGGIVGVIIASVLYGRRAGVPPWHVLDLAAFVTPIGLGLGRLANFINGELPGRALPESMQAKSPWWSIKYPNELDLSGASPETIASLRALVGDAGESLTDALVRAAYAGRTDVIEAIAPLLTARWPSQFAQAFTDGVLLPLVLTIVWWKPRHAGVVGGWFVLTYGVLRMATEQIRLEDPGVTMVGPLTLPMAISVLMIVAGPLIILWCTRHGEPVCGLRAPHGDASD